MATEDTTQQGVPSSDEGLASRLGAEFASPSEEPQEQPADAAPDAEQPQEDAGEDGAEQSPIQSLDELAESLGVSMDDLLTLKTKAKIDGEESETTLGALLKSYQLEGHVNRKSQELAEKQKAWETEQATQRNEWQQRIGQASQVLNADESQLTQQYQSVDWNALQAQDPALYSSTYLQFQQAFGQLSARKQALQQHVQQTQQQLVQQVKPRALQTIREQNPDLADPVAYTNTLAEMKTYLTGIGTAPEQQATLELDPTVFRVVRDAARYQALAKAKPDVAKKVKTAVTFQKASMRPGGDQRRAALLARAKKGDEDALATLFSS